MPRVPSEAPVPASRPLLTEADRTAYARGRTREVVLMRAALARLRRADGDTSARRAVVSAADLAAMEREGATAAGLEPARYHDLVARMDSALRVRGRGAGRPGVAADAVRAAEGSVAEWRLLDSLRVELSVLRSRFAAATGDPGGATP